METFELEKEIWESRDFNVMGWHDCSIRAIASNEDDWEFLFDIDYIFKWVRPLEGESHFKFWMAPVTMVFENVHSVRIDVETSSGIEIADLYMEDPKLTPNGEFTEHLYRFDCQEGVISLRATDFKMYVRQAPVLSQRQCLDLEQRSGIDFSRKFKTT